MPRLGHQINYLYQGRPSALPPQLRSNGIGLYGNLAMGVGFKLKIDDRSSSADYNAHEVGNPYVLPVKAWPMNRCSARWVTGAELYQ